MGNPSQRQFIPKMELEQLNIAGLTHEEILSYYADGGTWMSVPPIDLNELEQNTRFDFSRILYTPGVAVPSLFLAELQIKAQTENSTEAWFNFWEAVDKFTPTFRRVAIVTNGTRVLGLGDIGPFAAQQVMYGKSLLYNQLGGLYGEPHVVTSTDPDQLIEFVLAGQSVWGGVNLEDIRQPDCFYILKELRKRSETPVWHDDQQGTAAVILAGLFNALKVAEKRLDDARIVLVGFGAANTRTFEYLLAAGADPENCLCLDSQGIIHTGRDDIDWGRYPNKERVAKLTKPKVTGGPTEALRKADVVVGLSSPGSFTLQDIAGMKDNAIVFACANPTPEIDPQEAAKLKNVAVVGTGRSDFGNQVNNSLIFPGIMAGALGVGARDISDSMVIAGAHALANQVANPTSGMILPQMTLPNMAVISPLIAAAVAEVAIGEGLNRLRRTPDEVYNLVYERIERNQAVVRALSEAGLTKNI